MPRKYADPALICATKREASMIGDFENKKYCRKRVIIHAQVVPVSSNANRSA
jgi:hypothetical protein